MNRSWSWSVFVTWTFFTEIYSMDALWIFGSWILLVSRHHLSMITLVLGHFLTTWATTFYVIRPPMNMYDTLARGTQQVRFSRLPLPVAPVTNRRCRICTTNLWPSEVSLMTGYASSYLSLTMFGWALPYLLLIALVLLWSLYLRICLYEVATIWTWLGLKTTLGSPALQQTVAPAIQVVMPLMWLHYCIKSSPPCSRLTKPLPYWFLFQVMPFLVAIDVCFEPPSLCFKPCLALNFVDIFWFWVTSILLGPSSLRYFWELCGWQWAVWRLKKFISLREDNYFSCLQAY